MITKKPTAGALLVRKLTEAEDRIVELETALAFYAKKENWSSSSTGFALQYDPEPAPVQRDRGSLAMKTLMCM
jgi:hypothetical protein